MKENMSEINIHQVSTNESQMTLTKHVLTQQAKLEKERRINIKINKNKNKKMKTKDKKRRNRNKNKSFNSQRDRVTLIWLDKYKAKSKGRRSLSAKMG